MKFAGHIRSSVRSMGSRLGWLAIVWITAWPLFSEAQQAARNDRKVRQSFEAAIRMLQQGKSEQAAQALETTLMLDSNFAEAHQTLGDLLRKQGVYDRAVKHYEHVLRLKPRLTSGTWFGLGESLLRLGKYEKALNALQRFEAEFPQHSERTRISKRYIEDCRFSLAYFANRRNLDSLENLEERAQGVPTNFGPAINTTQDEYFPKLTADRRLLIFTRKSEQQENFYEAIRNPAGDWQAAQLLQGAINSASFNEGAHCISPDGRYLYFTGCNRPDGMGSCDIYVSRRTGGQWGPPQNLGAPINTSGWEAQPALSADGRALYFVSNRKGGLGGYDIWKSTRDTAGNWGDPINLGPTINTPFDESAPFIHADNRTLYFSSNGWPGFGDKDIFRSVRDANGQWQRPVNLGFPINDHTEQNAWSVSMNGAEGFFASRRPGGLGGLDIYTVSIAPKDRPTRVAYLRGRVTDAKSGQLLPGAHIEITDTDQRTVIYSQQADAEDGSFLAPMTFGKMYALHVIHPGYLFHSGTYSIKNTEMEDDVVEDDVDAYEVTVALSPIAAGQGEVLRNIFFETGKFDLLPESQPELERLVEFLRSNPRIRIEVGGHTDSTGQEADNQLLSERRAQAVLRFLVQRGIEQTRIQAKGYGQHHPFTSNQSAEGRRQNRRTDFRIIE